MENQLKPQVLDLWADHLIPHYLASNQLRLWLATLAYLLLDRMRTFCLRGTAPARATVGTIRLRLLKVAAQMTVSVRRVYVRLGSAFPRQELFPRWLQRWMTLGVAATQRGCGVAKPKTGGVVNSQGRSVFKTGRKAGCWGLGKGK